MNSCFIAVNFKDHGIISIYNYIEKIPFCSIRPDDVLSYWIEKISLTEGFLTCQDDMSEFGAYEINGNGFKHVMSSDANHGLGHIGELYMGCSDNYLYFDNMGVDHSWVTVMKRGHIKSMLHCTSFGG